MKNIFLSLTLSTLMFSSCQEKYELSTVAISSVDYLNFNSGIASCEAIDDGNILIVEKGVCWSEKSPATIDDNSSFTGVQDIGKYRSSLFNLKPGTVYYVRAYAKNLPGISYSDEIQIVTPVPEYLEDERDNQSYPIVNIGEQAWMAKNLNYYTKEGSWYIGHDSVQFSQYGRLYSWEEACQACPEGWRLPGYEDWIELIEQINNQEEYDSTNVCGSQSSFKLKSPGTLGWEYESDSITNETGFSAIGSGTYIFASDDFFNQNFYAVFWSSSDFSVDKGWFFRLEAYNSGICANYGEKSSGMSVRCIKKK